MYPIKVVLLFCFYFVNQIYTSGLLKGKHKTAPVQYQWNDTEGNWQSWPVSNHNQIQGSGNLGHTSCVILNKMLINFQQYYPCQSTFAFMLWNDGKIIYTSILDLDSSSRKTAYCIAHLTLVTKHLATPLHGNGPQWAAIKLAQLFGVQQVV